MSDEELIKGLTERPDCLDTVYAWQCWCPVCAANLVREYRLDPERQKLYLPAAVHERVKAAEVGTR